ncbi:hypothetical protein Fot_19531 [Forsythia ovata]|uniref:Protein ENHANCED DISEASE RESISTANCE 2 C-terminal domain-containing protein n=1 Tax=Forsythia ovata TaxID=205694 RepID=A0ABD1VLA6_9LAMI
MDPTTGPHHQVNYSISGDPITLPADDWSLNLIGVDWLRSNSKLDHVLSRPDSRVMADLRSSKTPKKSSKTFILAVNLQVPSRDHHSAIFYFSNKVDELINPNSLLYQFIHESNAFQDNRFKIVNKIVKGPWLVKTAVENYSVVLCSCWEKKWQLCRVCICV